MADCIRLLGIAPRQARKNRARVRWRASRFLVRLAGRHGREPLSECARVAIRWAARIGVRIPRSLRLHLGAFLPTR